MKCKHEWKLQKLSNGIPCMIIGFDGTNVSFICSKCGKCSSETIKNFYPSPMVIK